jgi:hypothetical protein
MEFNTTERRAGMVRAPKIAVVTFAFLVVAAGIMRATAGPAIATLAGISPELVAPIIGPIIEEVIPRTYEGSKDWGKTTTIKQLHSDGNFFKFDIHREPREVNDGVWKKYKLELVDPDKNLTVRIDNLHATESGQYALTLFVAAKIHGWARTAVYEKGVHIISLEAEGDTSIRLWLDADVGVETVKSSLLVPGVELRPKITDAKLKFGDFRLTRVSDVKGALAHDLGGLLRHALEKELSGPKLANKLNRSLEKHPEKLRLTPDVLIGKSPSKKKASG